MKDMGEAISFLGCDTPQKVFRERARQWTDHPALRRKERGVWYSVTWGEYYARARAVGLALAELGVAHGEVIAVLAENRPEWVYVDLGAQCMGMIGNGIYPTSATEQCEFILRDSGCRVVFVENEEQLDKVLAARERCPALERIVVMDWKGLRGFSDPAVLGFKELLAHGLELAHTRAAEFEAAIDTGGPDDIAFLVYTSGTTGAPKGAMISNRNLVFQISVADQYLPVGFGDKILSFLPLCHIAERMSTVFNQLFSGYIVHFPENAGTVFNDLREVTPGLVFAPPRFWEKLYSQIVLFMQDAIGPAQRLYRVAIEAGFRRAELRLAGGSAALSASERVLDAVGLANVRKLLGLQHLKGGITGAAPVPPELLKWYLALGIELCEGFGMTETTGFCTCTPPNKIKLGSAGVAAPGIELRLGVDGEILVRGPIVFAGYWGQPEKTAEAIDGEGWLHTGDVGEIDGDGYLSIKDRLKDIIITSGGKNITPSNIEMLIKFSPYISDAVVIGDARRFISCLVMIDQDSVVKFAQDRQLPFTDFASLTRAAEVIKLIAGEIARANEKLARVEQVKEFRILSQLLTAEDEELTPTMKLKRKVVTRKYAVLIESMYAG